MKYITLFVAQNKKKKRVKHGISLGVCINLNIDLYLYKCIKHIED